MSNKRTKILATVGPASADESSLRALVEAGADAFRLNFSHGSHDDHRAVYQRIRALEESLGRPIGVLIDLQGPKLRLGTFAEGGVTLARGDRMTLSPLERRDDNPFVTADRLERAFDIPICARAGRPQERAAHTVPVRRRRRSVSTMATLLQAFNHSVSPRACPARFVLAASRRHGRSPSTLHSATG
jgi:hypothetical protein